MRTAFISTLFDIAKRDKNVYLLTGDLGFGALQCFWDELPEQIINIGIAEQSMTAIAAGMGLEGKTVFTYSIGNFNAMRVLEFIRNDCAYHNLNVNIVSTGGGLVYGALGMSHHATEDIAVIRALPNVAVIAPNDPIEMKAATKAAYEKKGVCYLRIGRGSQPIHESIDHFEIGKAFKIKDGADIAIFFTGGMYDEVNKTDEILRQDGVFPALYSFPTVKPIDKNTVLKCAQAFDRIVTVEEHNICGGFGSAVAEVIAQNRCRARLTMIGLQDVYPSIVGSQDYLRRYYNIDASSIAEKVKEC